jgi:hypothetical protein
VKKSHRRVAEVTEIGKEIIVFTAFILCDLSVLCASAVSFWIFSQLLHGRGPENAAIYFFACSLRQE